MKNRYCIKDKTISLNQIAKSCKTTDEFIRKIQLNGLVEEIYKFENSTKENQEHFKQMGWFGIAITFWKENH